MPKEKLCGIYCIETMWDNNNVSASPALRTLAAHHEVPFEEKRVSTSNDLEEWLVGWMDLDPEYGILYIASHGVPGGIALKDSNPFRANVRLPQIADLFEDWEYSNEDSIIHLSACSTLRSSPQEIGDFFKRTGFGAVSGYQCDVDWIKSFAFDILYLDYTITNAKHYLSAEYMESVRFNLREHSWYGLGSALGFDIQTNER